MAKDWISSAFLNTLRRAYHGAQLGQEYVLEVIRPEGKEVIPLLHAIITYSEEMEELVIHEGVRTVKIFVRGWNSYHAERGKELFRKEDVVYSLDVGKE